MLKAVIFDLDGVLIDSEPLMRFAFDVVYREFIGEGQTPIEQYLEHMGESFPRIMDALGLPRTLWEPYRKLCQENLDRIAFYPEARTLLDALVERGIKLALLTGKDYARTSQILDHFNVHRYFSEVITSDRLSNAKPHPEGVIRALELLECNTGEAVMIGDAVNDIVCAQQAGVTAIAVTWGIKPERLERLCQPDFVVHNWPMLQQLLLSRVAIEVAAISPILAPEQYVEEL